MVLFFFAIQYDTSNLEYHSGSLNQSIMDINLQITPPTTRDPGIIRVLWYHPNLIAYSLSNEAVLLNICFTTKGSIGVIGFVNMSTKGLGAAPYFSTITQRNSPLCNYDSSYIHIVDKILQTEVKIENEGDLYIPDNKDGLIMKSPNGVLL